MKVWCASKTIHLTFPKASKIRCGVIRILKTRAPLAEIPNLHADEPIIPVGHGWATASKKVK